MDESYTLIYMENAKFSITTANNKTVVICGKNNLERIRGMRFNKVYIADPVSIPDDVWAATYWNGSKVEEI